TNFRVAPAALFAPYQERGDARQVALERQRQQIEHQAAVLLERRGDARWLLHNRQLISTLLLRRLDPPLDVTYGIQKLPAPRAVSAPEGPLQIDQTVFHRIQNASIQGEPGEPGLALGAVAGAKQPFEHRAGVRLHRERRGGVSPRERA